MEDTSRLFKRGFVLGVAVLAICALGVPATFAQPVPGGTLDPLTIPKYVIPLVIPPVMPLSTASPAPAADYDIAVRQFSQQILPGGIWTGGVGGLPATPVWSYGRAEDPAPDSSGIPGGAAGVAPAPVAGGSSYNYPAFTVEATAQTLNTVRWLNYLTVNGDGTGAPLPHILTDTVDQTLHWANPALITPCAGTGAPGTDCRTNDPTPYTGAVPMVVHVHGAHVNPQSDGYPEAWWLPGSADSGTYSLTGTLYDQYNATNAVLGSAYFGYENNQPATTLWYHDHTLGMTRLNVYAGPAGFWLVRGDYTNGGVTVPDAVVDGTTGAAGVLPGPAPAGAEDPNFVPADRDKIREIPIVIQDRSFNADGTLFYPTNRAFFEGLTPAQLQIPFIPDPTQTDIAEPSDISPIWNPEAFFNTMVVNGTTWPTFNVAQAQYRFRLLNGCNSRFLNLAMFTLKKAKKKALKNLDMEIPFYQIGAEQGFLPQVVQILKGFATPLPGNGTIPKPVKAAHKDQALLLGPAERADVIVDFSALPDGTVVQMINTAPDAPFGGFPDVPADPSTTGQVMQFVVTAALNGTSDTDPTGLTPATPPQNLVPSAESPLLTATNARQLTLNEEESGTVCVTVDAAGNILEAAGAVFDPDPIVWAANCAAVGGVPFAPKAALLGTINIAPGGGLASTPLLWSDAITENPVLGTTEDWEIYNLTVDAHPIHVHLVRFNVVNRQLFDPVTLLPAGVTTLPQPAEMGFKDTVIALPGEITRVRAKFDVEGLYVWHCHIVEHEDNEMMRPCQVV